VLRKLHGLGLVALALPACGKITKVLVIRIIVVLVLVTVTIISLLLATVGARGP